MITTRDVNAIRTAGFMQTIVDAIRSLQVIYEHEYFAVPAGGFR